MSDIHPQPGAVTVPSTEEVTDFIQSGLLGIIHSFDAVAEELRAQTRMQQTELDMAARFYSQGDADRKLLEGAAAEAPHRAAAVRARVMQRAHEAIPAAGSTSDALDIVAPPPEAGDSPYGKGYAARMGGARAPEPPKDDAEAAEYLRGWGAAEGPAAYQHARGLTSVKSISHSLAESMQARFQNQAEEALSGYDFTDNGIRDASTGRFVAEDDPSLLDAVARARLAGNLSNIAGGVAKGEGGQMALRALGSTPAKFLGYAGAAYTVADQAREFVQEQRTANLPWQRVLGGTNAEGFGERARSQLFEFQQSWLGGGIGAGDAEKLYMGAAEIFGTDRALRSNAQEFGLDAYRQFGLSIEDSLALVRSSAKAGVEDLHGLADAIDGVREVSRAAGVNAQEAVANFSTQVTQVGTYFSGSSVYGLAAAGTASTYGLGHQFEGIQTTAFSSEQQLSMQAAAAGLTLDQYLQEVERNPDFAIQTRAVQAAGLIGAPPEVVTRAQEAFQENGRPLNEGQRGALWREFEQMGYSVDSRTAQQILMALGESNVDIADARDRLLAYLSGEVYSAETGQVDALAEASVPRDIDDAPSGVDTEETLEGLVGPTTGDNPILGLQNLERGFADQNVDPSLIPYLTGEMGENTREVYLSASGDAAFEDSRAEAYRQYARYSERHGQTSPVIEDLLSHSDVGSLRFRVQTRDGDRVVGAAEAVRYFSDQLRTGTAEIVDSSNRDDIGRTVQDYVGEHGVSAENEADVEMTSAEAGGGAPDAGQSYDEFQEEQEDDDEGGGGVVYVEPSPALQDFITFRRGSGNVEINYNNEVPVEPLPPNAPRG